MELTTGGCGGWKLVQRRLEIREIHMRQLHRNLISFLALSTAVAGLASPLCAAQDGVKPTATPPVLNPQLGPAQKPTVIAPNHPLVDAPTKPASGRVPVRGSDALSANAPIGPSVQDLGAAPPPIQAIPSGPAVVRFEPELLDLGEMTADVAKTGKVRILNISDKPITITKAIPGCGCTTPTWTKEPILPGEYGETEITLKPGAKAGIKLSKRVTFQIEGAPPAVLTVEGNVIAFVTIAPDLIEAPAPTEKNAEVLLKSGEIVLESVDGTPFKVLESAPPIIKDASPDAALKHVVHIDWDAWAATGKGPKLSIRTDHPKAPNLTAIVKRSLDDRSVVAPPAPPTSASMPPMVTAVKSGDPAKLAEAIASAKDINEQDQIQRQTALHWAAKEGKLDMCRILIASKANVNAGDRQGKTALSFAAQAGFTDVCVFLVESGADVNVRDALKGNPLLWASGLGNAKTVEFLLSKGADPKIIDVNGMSALLWATNIGSPETVELLIAAGCDPNLVDNQTADSALHRAARRATSAKSIELLLLANANPNVRNKVGMTPLHAAASSGTAEKLQLLLSAKADPAALDAKGWSALDYATVRGDAERAKIIAILTPISPAPRPADAAPTTGAAAQP